MINKYLAIKAFFASMFFILTFHITKAQSPSKDSLFDLKSEEVTFVIDSSNKNLKNYLSFYYHDILGQGHPANIGYSGNELLLNSPTFLIEASDLQLPFLIYPNEKINIKYAGSDSVKLYIKGNENRNYELNFFRDLVKKTGNIYYAFKTMPYHKKVNSLEGIHSLEDKINQVKIKRLQLLVHGYKQSAFSDQFIKIANTSIQSTAFYDSLILYWNNRKLLIKNNLYKNLIQSKIESIKSIEFMPFQFYFKAVEAIAAMGATGNPKYEIKDSSDFVEQFNFISQNFTAAIKDYLLYRIISTAYSEVIPVSKNYVNRFYIECKNVNYKEKIAATISENKVIFYPKGSNNLMATDVKTIENIDSVILKNKGKVVLLDFWASWCGPCLQEMPFSRKLQEKYKNKDVAFVYISIDENTKDWLKANTKAGLENADSYIFLNSGNSSFIKKYKIDFVPRYILLDKKGNIISKDDLPRPSDPALVELINRFL